MQFKLNKNLASVGRWLHENSLFFNVAKTEAILFGTAPRLSDVRTLFFITINGSRIKQVSQFKYLGGVFDERLSWNDHMKWEF